MANLVEVEIELSGKKCTLRCSLRAARTVSALSGGFTGAFEGLSRYNLATYGAIVAAGLDKRTGADLAEVEESVYATGLEALTAPLVRFVSLLMNGGREPKSEDDAAKNE